MNTRPFPEPPHDGINTWMLEASHWYRREGMTQSEAAQRLAAYDGTLRRPFKRNEISRAVEHAYNTKLDKSVHIERKVELPPWNCEETGRIFNQSGTTAADLTVLSPEASPQDLLPQQILSVLFPDPDGLLCVGKSAYDFTTAPLRDHTALWQSQLIVPAYMTSPTGITQDGKPSAHCKANTGPRRYIVCDFDSPPPAEHAAIIEHLAKFRPLALALSSGGKSLHAWFPVSASVNDDRLFWRLCIALGADPALYRNPSQFVRMPNGTRANGKRQHVVYFNPQAAAL
jgi:hypothetical protein